MKDTSSKTQTWNWLPQHDLPFHSLTEEQSSSVPSNTGLVGLCVAYLLHLSPPVGTTGPRVCDFFCLFFGWFQVPGMVSDVHWTCFTSCGVHLVDLLAPGCLLLKFCMAEMAFMVCSPSKLAHFFKTLPFSLTCICLWHVFIYVCIYLFTFWLYGALNQEPYAFRASTLPLSFI